jgi:hypothetical protein
VMDKSGAGVGFLRELRFPLPIYIPSASPQSSSLSPEAGTIGQEWPEPGSELFQDLRFTANQVVLASSLLWLTIRILFFLQVIFYGHGPCEPSSLMRGWVSLL